MLNEKRVSHSVGNILIVLGAVGFVLASLMAYLFSVDRLAQLDVGYINVDASRPMPFELPSRKVLLIPAIVSMLLGVVIKGSVPGGIPGPIRLYAVFLVLMSLGVLYDPDGLSYALGALCAVVFLVALYGVGDRWLSVIVKVNSIGLIAYVLISNYYFPIDWGFSFLYRYGAGLNANAYAIYASLALISGVALCSSVKGRVFYSVVFVFLIFNLLVTQSRSSVLSLILALLIVAVMRKKWVAVCATGVIVFALIASAFFSGNDVLRGFVYRGEDHERLRLEGSLLKPIEFFFEGLLLPRGLSVGSQLAAQGQPLDNSYLWILLAGGIVPFLLYVVFVFNTIIVLAKRRMWFVNVFGVDRSVLWSSITVILFFFIQSTFEGSFRHILSWSDFTFLLSLIVVFRVASRRAKVVAEGGRVRMSESQIS